MRPPELDVLVARLRRALGGRLTGLYLYGSATFGGHTEGISDLDLLAVLDGALNDRTLAVLEEMHERFAADHPVWHDRIEVLYLPAGQAAGFRQQPAAGAVISPGEGLHRIALDVKWTTNLYLAVRHGETLHGPPAVRLLPPVDDAEFLATVAAALCDAPSWLDGPRHRGYHSYGVLSCARSWATLTEGRHLSKQQGAALARAAFPHRAALIDRALADRLSSEADQPATADAVAEAVEFARELRSAAALTRPPDFPVSGSGGVPSSGFSPVGCPAHPPDGGYPRTVMAVYVDDYRVPWRGERWSHLIADRPDELHAFAARLGLYSRRFHHKPARPWKDHYDVPEATRREAIRLGAEPIPFARAGQLLRARRQSFREAGTARERAAPSAARGGGDRGR